MKPPICTICGRRFAPPKGGLVTFADYEPLPQGMVGHPKGQVWFCEHHLAAAQKLTDLSTEAALQKIKANPFNRLRPWRNRFK